MNTEQPKKISRGRPRTLQGISEYDDIKQYNKEYYQNVLKERLKGDYVCEICNVYCSIANKSRHHKGKRHLYNKEIILKEINKDYDPENYY